MDLCLFWTSGHRGDSDRDVARVSIRRPRRQRTEGQTRCYFCQKPQKAVSMGLVTLRFGSFPPASPLSTPEQDIALTKWLSFSVLPNALPFRLRPRIFQMFMPSFLKTSTLLQSFPSPCRTDTPRTSCWLRPYPASLASLRFDLLAKLTASSKSSQLQFLRAQNNYWHLLMHNILSCTWYRHCDFLLISMQVYWRQRPLLTLYRSSYLERWHILVPSRWFHVALNQAGLDSVGRAKFLWHSIRNGPSGMTLSQQSGLSFLKYLILQDSGNSTPS